jgi:hypothetical protein
MTAMKKAASKSSKSLAPANKPALAAKPAAAPKPVKAAAKAPAKNKASASAPTVAPVAAQPLTTTITAQIDIGFGNALHIRGEGPGLSWDKGLLMNCIADDRWSVELPESSRAIVFKFLVNDLTWNTGEDHSVAPGSNVTLVPTF